jgi:hypothetical protein
MDLDALQRELAGLPRHEPEDVDNYEYDYEEDDYRR